jgi:hypothetical protein
LLLLLFTLQLCVKCLLFCAVVYLKVGYVVCGGWGGIVWGGGGGYIGIF